MQTLSIKIYLLFEFHVVQQSNKHVWIKFLNIIFHHILCLMNQQFQPYQIKQLRFIYFLLFDLLYF